MSIVVINAAPDRLLTTVDAVKASLGANSAPADDDIESMILEASAWVETYTGRVFAREHIIESVPGNGLPNLLLSRTPIIELIGINYDTTLVDEDDYTILDAEAGIIQRPNGWWNSSFGFGTIDRSPSSYAQNNIHVEYIGGYVLPNWDNSDGDPRTLPRDLERAVINLVASIGLNSAIDGGWNRYKIGDTEVSWGTNRGDAATAGIPANIAGVLNYYRRAW